MQCVWGGGDHIFRHFPKFLQNNRQRTLDILQNRDIFTNMSTLSVFVHPSTGFPTLRTLQRAFVERQLRAACDKRGGALFWPDGPTGATVLRILREEIPEDWYQITIDDPNADAWADLDAVLARYILKSAPFTSLRQLAAIMYVSEANVYHKMAQWKLKIQNWGSQ